LSINLLIAPASGSNGRNGRRTRQPTSAALSHMAHGTQSDMAMAGFQQPVPWSVERPEEIDRAAAWGVDGLITDRPDWALKICGGWKRT
jgi:glycerophosphoryl diester phosphodiesterase